jgi:hypothetical protein
MAPGPSYHIAHDSIQRHGSRLRQKIEAMELLAEEAKALSAAAADARETMVDAAILLIHQRVFSMLLEEPAHREDAKNAGDGDGALHNNGGSATLEIRDLTRLTRILVDLNRITIARQRQAEDARMRLEQQKLADRNRRAETEGGLSDEAYNAIRNVLLGIDPRAPKSDHPEGPASAGIPAAPGLDGPGEESGNAGVPAGEDNFEGPDWEDPQRSVTRPDADKRASTPKTSSDGSPGDAATSGKTRLRSADQGQMKCAAGSTPPTSNGQSSYQPHHCDAEYGAPRIAAGLHG